MPITAQDKKQVLLDAGIDPERYWIDDEGEVINMEKQGATESGVKSALYNAPRSALGFVGAALGTAGAGALGAPSGPGAIATGAAGGLAGAAAGATIGEKIQSALYPAGWQFAEEARSVRQPGAVYAGQLASNLVTMRPSPKMIGQLLSTAPKEFIKSAGQISPASRSAALNVLAGGALGGGVTMASGGDAGDVAREALVGALFHQPTKIGQKLSGGVFTPWTPDPTAAGSTGGMAEALQARAAAINKIRADAAAAERAARQTAFDEAVARGEAPMPVEDVPEPTPYEASGVEGELGVAPSENWNNWLASLAPKFKAKFRITDEPIRMPDGSLAAGEMRPRRTPAEMAEIDVSSSGRADTGGHEYLHDMIEDVLNYGTPRERAFMERAVKQLGLDVVESGGKRALRGNLEELIGPREGGALRSEEEMVQMLGEDIVRRAVKPEQFDTTKQALQDFTDYYLKNRMTPEAARRLLTGRLMYGRGTAPSVEVAARRAGKTAGAPAPAATSMAEKVEKTEIAPELAAEQARKAELDRAEAAQLKAENDAREARRVDMEAAFAARDKSEFEARMAANMENLPVSPKKLAQDAERQRAMEAERLNRRQMELDEFGRARSVSEEEGSGALTQEERDLADMQRFADTGGEMPAGELPLAEPDQASNLAEPRSAELVNRPKIPTANMPPQNRPVGSVRRGSERVMRRLTPEKLSPGTEVARPETLTYTGESIPANIRRGREMRRTAAESPEDLELRRIEDKLSGRSRSKYQPLAEEEGGRNVAYHAGDLKYGSDTAIGRMGGRSTGHYGTGTYFVGSRDKITGRINRPVQEVDLSGYNLAKPRHDLAADRLHEGLRSVNNLVDRQDNLNSLTDSYEIEALTKRMREQAEKAARDISYAIEKPVTADDVLEIAKSSVEDYVKHFPRSTYAESASTRLMRKLGFEGVDVRGLRNSDNTMRGTVVYGEEFKPRSKYQPFSTDFEKELAQARPFKLQVAKDGRMSGKDVLAAVDRLNPTEQEMIKSAGLDRFLRTVVRPNAAELKAWAEENVPRVEVKELLATGSTSKGDARLNEVKHILDTEFMAEQRQWRDSGGDFDALETVKTGMPPERASRFSDLVNELTELRLARRMTDPSYEKNDSATREFDTAGINPRQLADMPGAVDLLVRLPKHELTADRAANLMRKQAEGTLTKEEARELAMLPKRGERGYVSDPALYSSSHYPQSGDNLLAHVRAYEHTMPNGEKVLRVFELQSDWAQDRRKAENRYTVKQFNDGWGLVGKDGELTTYTFGASSSRPKRFDTKEQAEAKRQEIIDETANHPLLPHHQRLALKAAIEHARKRGIKRVVVDDAETAMLTEGHDRHPMATAEPGDYTVKLSDHIKTLTDKITIPKSGLINDAIAHRKDGSTFVAKDRLRDDFLELLYDTIPHKIAPPQERGMRLAYDNVLQQMMRDLSGEGVKVELGEHRNALHVGPRDAVDRMPWQAENNIHGETRMFNSREEAQAFVNARRNPFDWNIVENPELQAIGKPRKDLIFRNPDGTPKTQSTGYAYDVSAAQARRDAGEPFSYAGRKYQPMREEQIQSPEFKKWFGKSVVRDETGKPKMVYHGMQGELEGSAFRESKYGTFGRGIYFTDSPNVASDFAIGKRAGLEGKKDTGAVVPVHLSLQHPFTDRTLKARGWDKWLFDNVVNTEDRRRSMWMSGEDSVAHSKYIEQKIADGTVTLGDFFSFKPAGRDYTIEARWSNDLNKVIRDAGFDGIIGTTPKGFTEYVAFQPTQIKSATGNRGTFDPSNPDIRYQPLGPDEGSYKGAKLPAREQPRRGIFAGNVEALRRSGNPDKQYFAERADELFARIRNYTGKYENEILKPLVDLSTADQKALVELLYDEDATGTPITPAARLRPAYKAIRAGLKLMATDQIAAGQLIGGAPRGVNPTYFPNVVDPTVLHDLAYNTGSKRALELERQYIDYNTDRYMNKRGMSRADAAALARESFDAFRGALKPMSIEGGFDFGAVTMREGGKLPPTWVSADPVAGFRSYIKRFARSRAFYDTIQRDERAMAALGGKNYFDAAGREQPVTIAADNLARDPNARALMESAIGVTHESQEGITPAIGRLANSLLLSNVMTRVTDVATTPFKALSYLPVSEIPGLIGHLGNMRKSMENAYRTGGVRRGDMMVLRDVLGAGDRFVRGSDKLAEQIVKWTGSEALEKGARFLAQNVGEYVYDVNKTLAARGDKRALEFLNRLTPEWRTLDRAEVSQRVAQLFQGRYDATNLPIWIANSPAAPFFSMMKWNIEQWNNFKRFSWQPALNGDPMPLVKTLLGGALGGAIVGELREDISGKKQRVATMDELRFGFDKGDKSRAAVEAMRKAAFIAQVTGTLGIVGELGLQALDIGAKDKPQGFSWPAFEMAAGAVSKIQNAASAVIEKPDNAGQILANMANDLAKDNFSQYRLLLNTLDRAGVDTGAAAGPGQVEESNRRRDLRMSNKLRGEKVQFSPFIEADYAGTKERRMDKTRDMAEARRLGMELKREARAGAKTQEEYESALGKLRASRIVGIPSKENNPAQYRAHIQFVLETQGEEAAARLRQTYARLRREQQIKAAPFK